jgi:hypothetical protein
VINRFAPAVRARDTEHSIVYRNNREFAGWPFISGFWVTAEGHYLVAFKKKDAAYAKPEDVHHDEVAKVGPKMVTLRSRDKGRNWDPDSLQVLYDLSIDQEKLFSGPQDYSGEAPIDFTDPNVLVASGATPDYFRPHSRAWIRVSTDGGRAWRFLSRVNDWGAPGDIVRMADGRIARVYGYRLPPYGLRARLSDDDGRTWGREIILRDDGGSWDIGYPASSSASRESCSPSTI